MTIDDSGEWWVGSEPADLEEYLTAFTSEDESYPTKRFRLVTCLCGSQGFVVERASDVTRRTCAACGASHVICYSIEDWEEASHEFDVEPYACIECAGAEANVMIGFAHYDEVPAEKAVKWHYVGVRCAQCGILGCFNDGKIGWGPSSEVFDRA